MKVNIMAFYKNYFIFLVSFIFSSSVNFLISAPFLMGTIKYVGNKVKNITPIGIYHGGTRIEAELLGSQNKINFAIPRSPNQAVFYLLISESVMPVNFKDKNDNLIFNSFDYWVVEKGKKYKLYELTLVPHRQIGADKKQSVTYSWYVQKIKLDKDRRIPDEAIRIKYNPKLVDLCVDGSYLELPTIIARKQKKENDDQILEEQLGIINLNTLHTPLKKEWKSDNKKTIVVAYSI
jgi:hypothetical protein